MTATMQDTTRSTGPTQASPRDRLRAFSDRHRSLTILGGMVLVAVALPLLILVPPFSSFSSQNVWIDGFTIAGI